MIKEFVLEEQINNVKISKTKIYLKEVLSTYYHEDYRSCIVNLYIITIYDLLARIVILADVYNNNLAKRYITKYTQQTQPGSNSKYSDLEHDIIDIAHQLAIISDIEKRQIEELRNLRHDCAHPSISIDAINQTTLYQPNKDEVRSKIRLMFEILFLKDPNIMKYSLNSFENDIIDYYRTFGEKGFESYLVRTYYGRMNLDQKTKLLYSPLWYKLFLNNNDETKSQLEVYRLAIKYLIDSDSNSLLQFICDTPLKFSGQALKNNLLTDAQRSVIGEGMRNRCFILMEMLFRYPKIYAGLTSDIKQIVQNISQCNFNLMYRSYYIYNDLQDHANALLYYMQENDVANTLQYAEVIKQMYDVAVEKGVESLYNKVAIVYFTEKQNRIYNSINNAYNIVLSIALDYMTEDELLDLLDKCNTDSSIPEAYCFKDLMVPKIKEIAEEKMFERVLNHDHIK